MGELTLAVSRLNNEKVQLEQSMEMEEEGIVNRLQRVIETVMARNKVSVHTCATHAIFSDVDTLGMFGHQHISCPGEALSLHAAAAIVCSTLHVC